MRYQSPRAASKKGIEKRLLPAARVHMYAPLSGARKGMNVKVVRKAKAYNLVVNLQPGDVKVRVGECAGVVVHVRCKGEENISLKLSGETEARVRTDAAAGAAVLVVDALLTGPVTA